MDDPKVARWLFTHSFSILRDYVKKKKLSETKFNAHAVDTCAFLSLRPMPCGSLHLSKSAHSQFVLWCTKTCHRRHLSHPIDTQSQLSKHCLAVQGFDFSNTVHEPSSMKRTAKEKYLSLVSNPGPLGEKRERYLCAMRPLSFVNRADGFLICD